MTEPDPFEHDDAAYVLGALSDAERARFEDHLAGCAACTARVGELSGLPALLADVTIDDVIGPLDAAPDTLLPRLLREAGRRRRRQRASTARRCVPRRR